MGAKASTAAGNQSPRTFSNSSSSDVVSAGNNATSFNFLRAINGVDAVAADSRQRARSMSAVADLSDIHSASSSSNHHHNHHHYPQNAFSTSIHHHHIVNTQQQPYDVVNGFPNVGAGAHFDLSSNSPEESNPHDENNQMHALGIGRVVATSLPSHIWSLNGFKCPVCSKFILPDDIECHIVMCLTKPRLSYNEDVLNDPKGECVICLDDLNAGDVIARLPCLCVYHKGCIDRWFEVNRSCPEHPSD
ncbi:unnamed protein product [Chironomus riparius]|uniref:E3 ubiquitin-protein ligase ZNRF1 n=1 Tax=Chironomus riparius TaxID=315576 RepID=A0A9N9RVJ7_9DIPT|nr:unnamed protein product [Chironomus riparius]